MTRKEPPTFFEEEDEIVMHIKRMYAKGFYLTMNDEKILLTERVSKPVFTVTSTEKWDTITVVACGNEEGTCMYHE